MGKFPKKDEEKGGILHLPKKRRGKMGEFSIYPEKDEEKGGISMQTQKPL